jgi:predicted  nucleic acid-binding Zn-ribbon protein
MPEDVSASGPPDTRPLDRLVRRTRLLLRSTWVLTGLGLTLALLLGTLTAVTLLDVVAPVEPEVALTPERTLLPHVVLPGSALRLAALLLVLVPAAWVFVLGVLRPLFRRLTATQVARRIESHLPGIHNRLVSTLDLAGSDSKHQQSPAFFRRLLDEALERIRGFRPWTVIDHHSLRRAGLFGVAAVSAFVLAFVLFAQRLPTALARIFAPFADIPPASGVRYTVLPADAKVLRGEDVTFTVRVEHGDPGALRLELRSPENGQRLRYDLERQKADPHLWTFKLGSGNIAAGFENAFRYRVFGGGTWSKQYQLTMVDRPGIVSLHTVLHYPEYLGLPEPRVNPPQTADVTGPEGSRIEVVVEAEGQVASGTIQLLERLWVDGKVPPGAVAEGTWQWESQGPRAAHTEPVALGAHSHWFRDDPAGFAVQAGETLFADVYIPADRKPEGLMLQWHDGTGWEHRAVWGDDRFREGQANTPSRRRIGPLPKAGEWVRLQVPVKAVDLEGKTLRGLTFTLFGGGCFWGQAGALPPETRFAMKPSGDNQWTGSFPLERSGAYRVELRNELGHANKDMKEARFTALPDNPPQLVVERPATDLVLSQPQKVPLVLAAFDDFGLADVTLLAQKGFDSSPARHVLKSYGPGQRSDNLVSTLDLPALGMKAGDVLRYHVEARDRKGQIARSQDYQVHIAADPNSADQQMAAFEKSQDPFEQNLAKLLAEQSKVRERVEQLAAKYAPLMEKVEAAQAELREAPQGDPKVADALKQGTSLNLDPEAAKVLEALKKELGELGGKEQQNVQTAQQVAGELARSADQMSKMPMIPRQLSDQMKAAQQLFQQMAVPSLQDLAGRMTRGAEPRQAPPDLKGMQQLSDRVQKELEALRTRLQALADARRQLRDNADTALSQLQREMQRQNGGLTGRELEELRDFLARRQEELKRLEGNQEQLQ